MMFFMLLDMFDKFEEEGNLDFLTEIYVIGGSELIMPVQAIVIMFCSSPSPRETMTAGTGINSAPGLKDFFILIPF